MKVKQWWYCEACGIRSAVMVHDNAGAYEVIYRIEADHATKAPACTSPTANLRAVYRPDEVQPRAAHTTRGGE
jgi:hypothetical protein